LQQLLTLVDKLAAVEWNSFSLLDRFDIAVERESDGLLFESPLESVAAAAGRAERDILRLSAAAATTPMLRPTADAATPH
jgi:hypothetical protein